MISNYDNDYETIKNEFYNLYNNVLNIRDSLNYHNSSIQDLYLNESSTINILNNYYNQQLNEHPIGTYSNHLIYLFKNTFESWNRDQQNHFQSIGRYITALESVKTKIQRYDSNPIDSRLKSEVFKDVQQQFDSRVNQFDIPIINIQLSFSSLIQSLNSNLNESSVQLQKPINFISPINHLRGNNTNSNGNYGTNPNLSRNSLAQIPKPAAPRPTYNPPQVYNSPPTQQQQLTVTTPPQYGYNNNNNNSITPYQQHYPPPPQQQQMTVTTPPPQSNITQGARKNSGKSSLKQIERPPPVELPEQTFIEPNITRNPGDFLKDPRAPRFQPENVQPISKKPEMTSHMNMSLSEQYQKTKETRERMAAERKEQQDRMNVDRERMRAEHEAAKERMKSDRDAANQRMKSDRDAANQRMNAPPPPPPSSLKHR